MCPGVATEYHDRGSLCLLSMTSGPSAPGTTKPSSLDVSSTVAVSLKGFMVDSHSNDIHGECLVLLSF